MRREDLSERVSVILGDCREILPTLDSVDCVLTDPPYGIAHVWKGGFGHGWKNARAEAEARNEWDEEAPDAAIFDLLRAKSKHQIIWGGNYFDLPPSRCWFVWNKPERGFSLAEAELAWTNIDTVVRVCDAPRSEPGRQHPTQKPLVVMSWCIARLPKAKSFLDPYLGSGSSGVAAVMAGKSFVGIERDPRWFDLSCRRISDELRRPRLALEAPVKPVQEVLGL